MSSSLDKSVEAFNLLSKLNTTDHELSEVNLAESNIKNKRVAPRYVRDDIVVALCEPSTFFNKEIFIEFVKLNDISSRGLSISSSQNFAVQKKIVLNLHFQTGRTFKISATIVYKLNASTAYNYGVKFDEDNHDLADHLLDTQRKLILK